MTLRVRVKTRSAQEAVLGVRDGALEVRVAAPPAEGRANSALIRLLAKSLRVAPSALAIVQGPMSRVKVVRIQGVTPSELSARLEPGAAS